MKKLLLFIAFSVFSFHISAQEIILSDTVTYDSVQYLYELSEHILKPNRETLSIQRISSYDSVNDVAGKSEVFHSLIKYKDSYKEKGSVHIKIFFAEKVMGEWKPDVHNSMETTFHFRHKKVTYKGHGSSMQIGHKKLHLKRDDFDTREIKRIDMFKIAVEQFIIHYSMLFSSK
jgi:hypothetical protein